MFSIQDVIALAVRLEENGEAVYRDALKWVLIPEIRDLLKRLAEDEKNHAQWFAELGEALDKSQENPILDEMRRSLTDDFFAQQAFSLKDADITSVKTLEVLIEIAIGFEKDIFSFMKSWLLLFQEKTHPRPSNALLKRKRFTSKTSRPSRLKSFTSPNSFDASDPA